MLCIAIGGFRALTRALNSWQQRHSTGVGIATQCPHLHLYKANIFNIRDIPFVLILWPHHSVLLSLVTMDSSFELSSLSWSTLSGSYIYGSTVASSTPDKSSSLSTALLLLLLSNEDEEYERLKLLPIVPDLSSSVPPSVAELLSLPRTLFCRH